MAHPSTLRPRFERLAPTRLVGFKTRMSIAQNKTVELWQRLMPRREEVTNASGTDLYSVERYDSLDFFQQFDPTREFEKWAAIPVESFDQIPKGFERLELPEGLYAVFPYKGKPSEAHATLQFIFGQWLPQSECQLEQRPHFALMGEKYKGEDPESEEEFWIPVRLK